MPQMGRGACCGATAFVYCNKISILIRTSIMTTVIYLFAAVFFLLAAALVFTWWRNRHYGALMLAATYTLAAVLALLLHTWWPLVIGLLSAWSLRLMGLDPGAAVARKQDPPA
jgi:ABC-type multidrug transport system permease subunit